MPGTAVVVTDSTASLPPEVAAARKIVVVPLQVVIGATVYDEGAGGATPALVAQALREFRPVSTSRPAPAHLAEIYADLADAGATQILSVHLSAEMSGTYESALLAARESPVPVTVVDSRQVGVATGYAALSAADVLDAGGSVAQAADAARRRAERATTLFYVDTLEYLRRGGRIGAAAAILGGALSVKPLLRIDGGRVVNLDRVRTSSRALSRMEDLIVEAAGEQHVEACVSHLANPQPASELAARLGERLAANLEGRDVWCGEIGAVLGAHVGPGMVAVCVSPIQAPG
jgi:DegV family protein with EDD domain